MGNSRYSAEDRKANQDAHEARMAQFANQRQVPGSVANSPRSHPSGRKARLTPTISRGTTIVARPSLTSKPDSPTPAPQAPSMKRIGAG